MCAHLLHDQVQAEQVGGFCVVEDRVAVGVDPRVAVLVFDDAFVGQAGILEEGVNGVEAEAAYAAFQPKANDFFEGLVDFGVVPVQVRLLYIELVVVVLAGLLIPLPG